MNLRTTILLIALAASVIGCIILVNWRQGGQDSISKNEKDDEKRKLQILSAASSTQTPSSSDEADEEKNLMEELLSFLPEDNNDRKIIYAGGELYEVEGLYIDEDSESGYITVIGFTKISFLDGRCIHVGGDDATLTFDPTSGSMEFEAILSLLRKARNRCDSIFRIAEQDSGGNWLPFRKDTLYSHAYC